eukprot:jgi/Tetstr1/428384/TSEL_018418.t1
MPRHCLRRPDIWPAGCMGARVVHAMAKADSVENTLAAYVKQLLQEWASEQRGHPCRHPRLVAQTAQLGGQGLLHIGLARVEGMPGQAHWACVSAALPMRTEDDSPSDIRLSWRPPDGSGALDVGSVQDAAGSDSGRARQGLELSRLAIPGLRTGFAAGLATMELESSQDLQVSVTIGAAGSSGSPRQVAEITFRGRRAPPQSAPATAAAQLRQPDGAALPKSGAAVPLPPPARDYTALFRDDAEESVAMRPIGHIRSRYTERHGTPRQAALAEGGIGGDREGEEGDAGAELLLAAHVPGAALTALDGFDYVWILAELHLNRVGNPTAPGGHWRPLVRPPPPLAGPGAEGRRPREARRRRAVGVLATRAPHRPNPIALSAVRVMGVDVARGRVRLGGVDLLDGTPVLDIKPYVPYADAFPDAAAGWTAEPT